MTDTDFESVCLGKTGHPTKPAAVHAANVARVKFGGLWKAQKCPFCDLFHTKQKARVKDSMTGRRRGRRANAH